MTKRVTTTLLVLAAVAVGCGSDEERGEPIPAAAATELQARLDEVQRRFDFGGGACGDIQNDSKPAVDGIIGSLPNDVDADTRDALQQSFDRLFELSDQECGQDEDEPETEPETETVPPETETVPPETETLPPETETVPPETETVPLPEEETVPPADEDDGTGGGGVISPGDEG